MNVLLANAGTPLIWLYGGHLVAGNLLIGLLEAAVLVGLFKTTWRRSCAWLVIANYASACLAWLTVRMEDSRIAGFLSDMVSIETALPWSIIAAIGFLAASILIEWPFVLGAMWKSPYRWSRSIAAAGIVQLPSYAVLVFLYWAASYTTLYTAVTHTDIRDFAQILDAWIYFISPDDGDIWRIHPDGSDRELVSVAELVNSRSYLFAKRGELESCSCSLWVQEDWAKRSIPKQLTNITVSGRCAPFSNDEDFFGDSHYFPFGYGVSSDLRAQPSATSIHCDYWPAIGLVIRDNDSKDGFSLGMETPFVSWLSQSPSILDGDQVIYQLGDWIVLLDVPTRRFGIITRGRGPVVVQGAESVDDKGDVHEASSIPAG